jgi:outer membrane receptor for ferrienterochelin and colicin
MKKIINPLLMIIVLLVLSHGILSAQTTGKLAGMVTDASSGEPLAGANVFIENTNLGAAVDLEGAFYILNIPPGNYSVIIEMIGYETQKYEDLRISVNRTVSLDVLLKPAVLEGEVIVVQADKIASKKDQTGSIRTVSSEQMEVLPIESVNDVVAMQAGVVNGHFRGGRMNEVSYLIDGLPVDDAFGGVGRTVELEAESIQDLEVITGNFNAEYGRAMSGVVNAVTKDGGAEIHGTASADFANYFTTHDDIFPGANNDGPRWQDYNVQLSGPLLLNDLFFFANARYQDNKGHLNGIRRFNVDDFSSFTEYPNFWYSEATGDSAFVPMNDRENLSLMGKITYRVSNQIRTSLMFTRNDDKWRGYNHAYKYNPDGIAAAYRETNMFLFQLNHMVSNSAFYEFKASYIDNQGGNYLYEDPLDPGYNHDIYLGNNGETGFYTGGQDKNHSTSTQKDLNLKLDFTWQVNTRHSLKLGSQYIQHELSNHYSQIRNEFEAEEELWEPSLDEFGRLVPPPYAPKVFPDSSSYSDFYDVDPMEFSAYLQDKMEYEDMVLNLGARFDYFDPKTVYPSQRRNPANQSTYEDPERNSKYIKADPQYQVSPRISLGYQLGTRAVLRFSYGHFFQMPPMYSMYQNNSFLIVPTDYATTMGNAQVKAQKTVQYEIGLWQEVMHNMGVEVALYYRDHYNLLSAVVVSTYNQIEYGLYSNKDYGNSKGLEFKWDYSSGNIRTFVNYTLQYTRGNADNPTTTFSRAGASLDPIAALIPMSWDQRHTLNATVGYYMPQWGTTLTGYFNSGVPYTWSPLEQSVLANVNLYPNNAYQPERISFDLSAYYLFNVTEMIKLRLTMNVYNLFDRLNENSVNGQTGRAYTAIVQDTDLASHRSNFNDYYDRIQNPAMFSAPRQIKVGLGIIF